MSRQGRWCFMGRRVKVNAVACAVGCMAVIIGVFYEGPSQTFDFSDAWGLLDGLLAACGLTLLIVGWWFRSKRLTRWGYLVTAYVFAARALLTGFAVGVLHPATWISVAAVVVSGGTYLLEARKDDG